MPSPALVSKHFPMSEFVAAGFPAAPTQLEMRLLQNLVTTILDPLRDDIGSPITIDGGSYRTEAKYEEMLGHYNPSPISDHFWGQPIPANTPEIKAEFGPYFYCSVGACDLTFPKGPTPQAVFDRIRTLKLPVGQCILEMNGSTVWVHVANPKELVYTPAFIQAMGLRRPQYLTSTDNGKTYQPVV